MRLLDEERPTDMSEADRNELQSHLPYAGLQLNELSVQEERLVLFHLRGGRYLAEDSGFTFNVSRDFKSGLNMGVFFSLTDISKAEFGEGSFDKGFYFSLPVDLFFNTFSKERMNKSL